MTNYSPVRICVAAVVLLDALPSAAQSVTRTRLLSDSNPSSAGAPIHLRAEVDAFGDGPATGSVVLWDRTTRLGAARLETAGAGQSTLAGGTGHTCALTRSGGVRCWGYNGSGQLGDGTTINRLTAVSVVGLPSGVVAVSAGLEHSCAVTASGGLKCWGDNRFGELGDGTTTSRLTPVDVTGLTSGVIDVAAGDYNSCALTASGGVKCWGTNLYGQLGDGTRIERHVPVDTSGLTGGVTRIAMGGWHACAVTNAGGAKCWGFNREGQIGDGTHYNRRYVPVEVLGLSNGVVAVSAGGYHSCALMNTGGVRCWGNNNHGELGNGTTTDSDRPVDTVNPGAIVAIASGGAHNCALTKGDGVKCWGDNEYSQIGDGTSVNRRAPVDVVGLAAGVGVVQAGGGHSCATMADTGRVECWGSNNYGGLGDGTTTNRSTPVEALNHVSLVRTGAAWTLDAATPGIHWLKAVYHGDARHTGSSALLKQDVR